MALEVEVEALIMSNGKLRRKRREDEANIKFLNSGNGSDSGYNGLVCYIKILVLVIGCCRCE
jgi:hypothetical protein